MPLRSHLSAILNAALVLTASALSDPLCAAQQPLTPGHGSASPLQHGSTEVLVEKLVREREIEGLLSDSVLERDGRLSETAIEALSQIFSHPVDVFEIEPKTGKLSVVAKPENQRAKPPEMCQDLRRRLESRIAMPSKTPAPTATAIFQRSPGATGAELSETEFSSFFVDWTFAGASETGNATGNF